MATINVRKAPNGRKYYQLNYQENGKQKRSSLGRIEKRTRREVRTIRDVKNVELETGQPLFVAAPTFDQFRERYLAWHARKYPAANWRVAGILNAEHMAPFLGKVLTSPELVELIENWLLDRADAVARNTVVKEFRTLHAFFRKAMMWKTGVTSNPCKEVDKPKVRNSKPRVAYEPEDTAKLYRCKRHGAKWKLLANTGMRRAEFQAAEPEWFDLRARKLTIISQEDDEDEETGEQGVRTKSGHFREVPLNDAAIEAYKELMEGRENAARVCPAIAPQSLSRAFKIDARRCGLKGSMKSLRHSYATKLSDAGIPLATIQKALGHAHISTTMIYARPADATVLSQLRKIAV